MERLKRRVGVAERALATLAELVTIEHPSLVERDAAIQRFEYTVEACWNAARAVLDERYGVVLASPNPPIRAFARNRLLSEDDAKAAMAMIDDRNRTARTYDESMAAAIHGRLKGHAALPHRWLPALAAPYGPARLPYRIQTIPLRPVQDPSFRR